MKKAITVSAVLILVFAAACTSPKPAPSQAPAGGGTAPAATMTVPMAIPTGFTLEMPSGNVIVSRDGDGTWKSQAGGMSYSVKASGNSYIWEKDGAAVASGSYDNGKLKMTNTDGSFLTMLKLKEGKIKVYLTDEEGAPSFDIKGKEDKFKVKQGETEYGKFKFYPENGKCKLKDPKENEIAVVKGMKGLFAGPAAFLIPGIDDAQKNFLMLTLLALGK